MISVIVPTFNEEENICDLLSHLKRCDNYDLIEVIICDSPHSMDDGFEKAAKLGAKCVLANEGFRAFQMNYGAKHANNEILYFLHADARPPIDFVDEILKSLKSVDFGFFSYRFNSNKLFLRINSFFTKFNGIFAGGGDQSLFIDQRDFQSLGGFDNSMRIMEDFDFFKRAKAANLCFEIIDKPLLVSARKYEQNSWLKVNLVNLQIFATYLLNGSQDRMIRLNKKLRGV